MRAQFTSPLLLSLAAAALACVPTQADEPEATARQLSAFTSRKTSPKAQAAAPAQVLGLVERTGPLLGRPRGLGERPRGAIADVYARVAPSVVIIRDEGGHGTGLVLNPSGLVLTNAHVVRSASFHDPSGGRQVLVNLGTMRDDGAMEVALEDVPAVVLKVDDGKDLSLVKLIELPPNLKAPAGIRLADADPRPGQECLTIGHPAEGQLWMVRNGLVTGIANWPRDEIDVIIEILNLPPDIRQHVADELRKRSDKRVVNTNCGLFHGDSGGPLLNSQGELIAVNFAMPGKPGPSGLSFHVHLAEVRAFLKEIPEKNLLYAPPDPWPSSLLVDALDLDRDGTLETLAFSESRSGAPVAYLIDLDQNHNKTDLEGDSLQRIVEGRNWDFEFALNLQGPLRTYYDSDNDGAIDAVHSLVSEKSPLSVVELNAGRWVRGRDPHAFIEPSRFADAKSRERLGKILSAAQSSKGETQPGTR